MQAKRDGLMVRIKRESSVEDAYTDFLGSSSNSKASTRPYALNRSLTEVTEDDQDFDAMAVKQEYPDSADFNFACLMSHSPSSSSSSPFSGADDQNKMPVLFDSDVQRMQ